MIPNTTAFRGSLGAIVLSTVAAMFLLSAFAETFTEGKQVPPTDQKLKAATLFGSPSVRRRGRF